MQLSDSIYGTGSPAQVPEDLSASGFNQLFNLSTRQNTIDKGETQIFFLRWFSYDGLASEGAPKTFTSSYAVKVDDYSQLVIPHSSSI